MTFGITVPQYFPKIGDWTVAPFLVKIFRLSQGKFKDSLKTLERFEK